MTSVPGRNEGGAARYGTISGSSAAAALVAGAAALLADARPDLDAAGLRGALVATARLGQGGSDARPRRPRGGLRGRARRRPARRPRSARSHRGTPGALGTVHAAQRLAVGRSSCGCCPGRPRPASRSASAPARFALQPGDAASRAPRDPRPRVRPSRPGRSTGAVRAVVGPRAAAPHPVERRRPGHATGPSSRGVRLSTPSFRPSDAQPAVLSLVAGRVDGSARAAAAPAARRASSGAPPRRASPRDARAPPRRAAGAVRVRRHRPRAGRRAAPPRRVRRSASSGSPVGGGPRVDASTSPFRVRLAAELQSAASCELREAADERHRGADPPSRESRTSSRGRSCAASARRSASTRT